MFCATSWQFPLLQIRVLSSSRLAGLDGLNFGRDRWEKCFLKSQLMFTFERVNSYDGVLLPCTYPKQNNLLEGDLYSDETLLLNALHSEYFLSQAPSGYRVDLRNVKSVA